MDQRLRHYRSDRNLSLSGTEKECYRSPWYRGLEDGMEWLRLSLEGAQGALVRVYASDSPPQEWDGALEPAMERCAEDLLLYGVYGRFLCFTVQPARELRGFELSFPANSIDSGLPAAMRGDGLLRRFLGIYQSLYMDLNREYSAFPQRLDPLGPEPLPWLEGWVGARGWTWGADETLRAKLTAAACALNRERGTRRGLARLVRLVTGGQGRLIERFRWERSAVDAVEQRDCARLYGTAQAVLLLPPGTPQETARFLRQVLKDFLPVGMDCAVIILEDGAPIGGYCYLDENAKLGEMLPSRLDGGTLDELILG